MSITQFIVCGLLGFCLAVSALNGPLRPYVPMCSDMSFGFCKKTTGK